MTINRLELYNDAEEAQRQILDGRQSQVWTAMPGIVTSVNFSQMTVEVQPAIQGIVTDENGVETNVNLPKLVDCPIQFPSAGGFIITFPIVAGDEVLIIWAARCIDAWWQQGGIQPQAEFRMHDLSDGHVIPGVKSLPNVVASISTTDLQIRNNAGTSIIGMKPDGSIYLTPVSGKKVTINGSLQVNGTINSTGETTAGTIPLTAHVHPQTGGPNTDPPIP